jgi:hypothetical protein
MAFTDDKGRLTDQHTVTVTRAYNSDPVNHPYSMMVVDNAGPEFDGTGHDAIGERWVNYTEFPPSTLTIYRLSPDHLYLIDGSGSSDNVTLVGNQFNDLIKAGSGNDRLYGGSGSDVLVGGTGNDWFDGGPGVNTMTAGSGKNIFHFGSDGSHYDSIYNFQIGRDTLDLGDVSGLTGSSQLYIGDTANGAYIGYWGGNNNLNIILGGLTADQIKAHPEMFRFAGMPEIPFNLPINLPPEVTAHDVTVHAGASVALSSLFAANDPDGDSITQYMFMDDGSGGHFEKGGVVLASHTWQYVSVADLAKVTYVGGDAAGSDKLYVAAYDGQDWSANASLTATTLAPQPPVVTAHDVTVHAGAQQRHDDPRRASPHRTRFHRLNLIIHLGEGGHADACPLLLWHSAAHTIIAKI